MMNPSIHTKRCLPLLISGYLIAFVLTAHAQQAVKSDTYQLVENIRYRPDTVQDTYSKERCVLDVYYPENGNDFPTVVWFHGGGITGGEKFIPNELKEKGLAVVAVNYRLSPKVKAPTYIDDAAAAIAWVFKHIEEYGGNRGKIFISGHSAGGYLVAMVGLDKSWLRKYGEDADKLAGIIDFSGHAITHMTIRAERGIKDTQPIVDEYAPLYHVRRDAPPFVLVSGDREQEMLGRYEETAYFYRMMKVVGHPQVYLYELDGFDHGAMASPGFHILLHHVNELTKVAPEVADAQEIATLFNNPLDVAFGDPYVIYDDAIGRYFMYGTGGGAKNGFSVYSSADLANWKNEGQVYHASNKNGWSDSTAAWGGAYWAPEVYAHKGKFYLFYSAQWKDNPGKELENFRIGVAVADKPTGPFIDLQSRPVFDPGYPIIDANVYFAEDGRVYLYYSRCCYKHAVKSEVADWAKQKGWFDEIEESWVYGVELKPDFSGIIGEPVLLLRPPEKMDDAQAEWESRSVTSREVNRRWTEGSFTFKHGDTYYMMYSANHFAGENYAVGYATAKSPLGPFTKAANNPVLEKNTAKGGEVTGTGHNSVVFLPDGRMLCVYHGRTKKTGDERVVFIDEMGINEHGVLTVLGPTTAR